jgi:hypothetical protein
MMEMITPGNWSPAMPRTPAADTPPRSPDKSPRSLGDPAARNRALRALASVPTESPRNPDRQVTWFGLRHVFVLVEMTDARPRLHHVAALANASAAPPHVVGARLATGLACPPRATRVQRTKRWPDSGPAQSVPERRVNGALGKLPNSSPPATDTVLSRPT